MSFGILIPDKLSQKAVEQKKKVKPVIKKVSPKKPAGSKSSKSAPISNTSNQAYSYILEYDHIPECEESLIQKILRLRIRRLDMILLH